MSVRDLLGAARTALRLRACEHVGRQPRLHGRPTIMASAGGRILIGDRFRLASRPVRSHLVAGPRAVLEIGHDVSIAHGAAIASFERVRIGGETCIGPFVVIMDTNFHGAAGNLSVQHDCRPVVIGSRCRIGSRVTITRGASIGDGAEILAGSVVYSAIPPGVCVAGAPARILGRAGEAESRWDGVAAVLPELVMQAFGLEAPPDLDTPPVEIPGWNAHGVMRLIAAIELRLGVSVEAAAINGAFSLTSVAGAVERAKGARSGPPAGQA